MYPIYGQNGEFLGWDYEQPSASSNTETVFSSIGAIAEGAANAVQNVPLGTVQPTSDPNIQKIAVAPGTVTPPAGYYSISTDSNGQTWAYGPTPEAVTAAHTGALTDTVSQTAGSVAQGVVNVGNAVLGGIQLAPLVLFIGAIYFLSDMGPEVKYARKKLRRKVRGHIDRYLG